MKMKHPTQKAKLHKFTPSKYIHNCRLLLIRISNSFHEQQIARYGDFPTKNLTVCLRGCAIKGKINSSPRASPPRHREGKFHLNYRALRSLCLIFHNYNRWRSGKDEYKSGTFHVSYGHCVLCSSIFPMSSFSRLYDRKLNKGNERGREGRMRWI